MASLPVAPDRTSERYSRRVSRMVMVLLAASTLMGCANLNADPAKNVLEVYRTDTPFEDVVSRMQALVREQKWLPWVTRTIRCFESETAVAGQWRAVCGLTLGGPTTHPTNTGFRYDRWFVINRIANGTEILTTEAVQVPFGRFHPNTEIFEKINVKATLIGKRKPG